jgi:hypothetical protein
MEGRMIRKLALVLCVFATPTLAQQATFNDPLVDHLAGKWVLSGQMQKRPVTHDIAAQWVLAHQYLKLDEVSREKNRDGSPVYQATGYIGWDAGKKIYDCVWLDDTAASPPSRWVTPSRTATASLSSSRTATIRAASTPPSPGIRKAAPGRWTWIR